VVNDVLDYEIDKDDDDKDRSTFPSEKRDSKEDASKQAVNERFGDNCPIPALQMTEGQLLLPGTFDSQNQEQHGQGGEQNLNSIPVSAAQD